MEVIEYEDKYLENVKDLLVELEEYLVSIDYDELEIVHSDFREEYVKYDFDLINKQEGKCYLAIDKGSVVGLIMGYLRKYDDIDRLDYKCPKEGVVSELIVSKNVRSKGIGRELMAKMEDYFRSKSCEYIVIEVFGYNDPALKFYYKQGYHVRGVNTIKKL